MMAKRKYSKKTKRKYNHTTDYCLKMLSKLFIQRSGDTAGVYALRVITIDRNGNIFWHVSFVSINGRQHQELGCAESKDARMALNKMVGQVKKVFPNGN